MREKRVAWKRVDNMPRGEIVRKEVMETAASARRRVKRYNRSQCKTVSETF